MREGPPKNHEEEGGEEFDPSFEAESSHGAPAEGGREEQAKPNAHSTESRLDEIKIALQREAAEKPTIIFLGGFTAPEQAYADEIEHLESQGYTVHYLNPDKGADLTPEEAAYFEQLNDSSERPVPDLLQRQSAEVRAYLETNGIGQAVFVGHSKGGSVATAYAASHPEGVSQLVLDNPSGLMGADTQSDLRARSRETQKGGRERAESIDRGKHFKKNFRVPGLVNFLKRPIFRLKQEIPSIAETDITDMLGDIKAQGGTEVVLLTANSDRTYPKERVATSLGVEDSENDESSQTEVAFEKYIDRWATYAEQDADHYAPITERAGVLQQVIEENLPKRTKG